MKNLSHALGVALICGAVSATANVHRITSEQDYNYHVLNSENPVVVKYSANWCGVCSNVTQPFEDVSSESEFNHVNFVHVDIDELSDISEKKGIVGVPTFAYMQNGKEQKQEVGIKNLSSFKDNLRKNLRRSFKVAQNDASPSLTMKQRAEQAEIHMETMADEVEKIGEETADNAGESVSFIEMMSNLISGFIQIVTNIISSSFNAIKSIFGY